MTEETISAAEAKTRKLIADLWARSQPQIMERLAVLDAAAKSACSGTLGAEEQHAAESVAHKLSGSLGMFGFPDGTDLARELEAELRLEQPKAERLLDLATALRAVLYPAAE